MSHQDSESSATIIEKQNSIEYLNKIIATQARLAAADFNLTAFMALAVEQMEALTPATGVVIELLDDDHLVYRACTGSATKYLGLRFAIKDSISGLCIKTQQTLFSEDTEKDSRVNVEMCRLIGARSMVVAPLLNNGTALGVLKILAHEPQAFNPIHVQTLQVMAGLIGSALAHQLFYETTQKLLIERTKMLDNLRMAENQLQYQAYHDYLTDLPNRALFNDKLLLAMADARRQKQLLALIYLDIDHFKTINDTLGHAIGDALLKAFSLRLKEGIGATQTAARFGGDEFVVLLGGLNNTEPAIQIAQAILSKTQEPFHLLNKKLQITTSLGLTFFSSSDLTADALLSQADQALYAAKHAGRNTMSIFNSSKLDTEEVVY